MQVQHSTPDVDVDELIKNLYINAALIRSIVLICQRASMMSDGEQTFAQSRDLCWRPSAPPDGHIRRVERHKTEIETVKFHGSSLHRNELLQLNVVCFPPPLYP